MSKFIKSGIFNARKTSAKNITDFLVNKLDSVVNSDDTLMIDSDFGVNFIGRFLLSKSI